MAGWFDKTNAQDAFAATEFTRTVLHGQAEKGNPLSKDSFIIALSGKRHDDGLQFLTETADDKVWVDVSKAFAKLYQGLADPDNHMWLINFIKKDDAGNNDTNSQIPEVHIHVLSGPLTAGSEHIAADRTFHPHPKKEIYSLFQDNKADITAIKGDAGVRVYPLPDYMKEAESHYAVRISASYASFADFMINGREEEQAAFWKMVAKVAAPLVEQGQGARVGHYNFDGQVTQKAGVMVEVAGGENLGQNGAKNRWFQKPKV